jgi:hypothetical protein
MGVTVCDGAGTEEALQFITCFSGFIGQVPAFLKAVFLGQGY